MNNNQNNNLNSKTNLNINVNTNEDVSSKSKETEQQKNKKRFEIEFKELVGASYKHGNRFKTTPKWIVVHYTAVIGASAKSCAKSYSKTTRSVSTHFFCDSQDIYRVVDEKHIAWHVGDGQVLQPIKDKKLSLEQLIKHGDKSNWRFKLAAENHLHWKAKNDDFKGNSCSFGVDLCTLKANKSTTSVKDEDWNFNELAIRNAEKCVAYLCHKYNIAIDHVIRHCDATGKPCPRPFVSLSGDEDKTKNDNDWLKFKDNVQIILNEYEF